MGGCESWEDMEEDGRCDRSWLPALAGPEWRENEAWQLGLG